MSFSFQPEEFIVEEICLDGSVLEAGKKVEKPNLEGGKFCHFVLEKRLWNTAQALNAIASRLHLGRTRFNAAGTKDRNAITVQLVSVFAGKPEHLLSAKVKDITINGAWLADKKLDLGDLLGNRFTLTLNEANCGKKLTSEEVVQNAAKNGGAFPNLFGSQRFGSLRMNSHLVGKLLLQENWRDAALNFLTYTDEMERNKEAVEARKKLASELDFKAALNYYPGHLKFERTLIGHLANSNNDFVGALRKLPRHTLLLFLHAYQSFLFNKLLEKKLAGGRLFEVEKGDSYCSAEPTFGFPDDATIKIADKNLTEDAMEGKIFPLANLVGRDTQLTSDEKQLLEEEGIEQSKFNIKGMPELTSKGTQRPVFVRFSNFQVLEKEPLKVQFSLPSGSYATVAMEALLN
ncbi:MAG: tRNA pseudouridine(13) synthase TruD [Candidatus Micrarchaeota archaeon]|nr:tRNA pseudouridine(13) synthase TruD [Candidatus Micrarchaeota archaeon]